MKLYVCPKNLLKVRSTLGLSQKEISKMLDVSHISYSSWERGAKKPTKKNKAILLGHLRSHRSILENKKRKPTEIKLPLQEAVEVSASNTDATYGAELFKVYRAANPVAQTVFKTLFETV